MVKSDKDTGTIDPVLSYQYLTNDLTVKTLDDSNYYSKKTSK